MELLEQLPEVEVLLVPLGNGALLGGVAAWFKHAAPHVAIVGAVAAGAPCMQLSLRKGQVIATDHAETIPDGVAVTRVRCSGGPHLQ